MNKETIEKYAEELLFRMTDQEIETLLKEFTLIDSEIDLINNIDGLNKIEPMYYPHTPEYVSVREDVSSESLSVEEAFKNSDKVNGREVEVPRVVS